LRGPFLYIHVFFTKKRRKNIWHISFLLSSHSDGLDGRGTIPGRGKRVCTTVSRPPVGPTQSHIQWIPGAKQSGREAVHSPPPSAEVKNGGSTPPRLHTSSWRDAQLMKHRDTFISFLPSCFEFRLFAKKSQGPQKSRLSPHCRDPRWGLSNVCLFNDAVSIEITYRRQQAD
jgi:hypothetical protein